MKNPFGSEGVRIPESDEVLAYPKILQLLKTNWWEYALTGDSDMKQGLTMAAVYTDKIKSDMAVCKELEATSGLFPTTQCARPLPDDFTWPKNC